MTATTRGGSPSSQQQLFHQRPVFFEVLGRIDEESSFRASIASQNDCSSHQSSIATSFPQDERRHDRASVLCSQQHDHPKQQPSAVAVAVAATTTPSANQNPPNEQIRRENEGLFDECKALESMILQMRQNSSLLHVQSNLRLQDLQTDIDRAIREREAVRASCRELEEQIDTVRTETNRIQRKIETAEETLRQQQKQ